MKKKKLLSEKKRKKIERLSLAVLFAVFVFAILLSSIAITALGVWLLSEANLIAVVDGEIDIGQIIFFMTIISLVFGGIIAFFGSFIPLKSANELIDKMNRLATGDFKTRIKFKKQKSIHPAIKEFADSFNKMAEELENTELFRNDFINDFSHEFKTPIVSITGLANLLEVGNLTEEQRSQYVRAIREESMRLSSMANNILSLSKVEKQKILTDVSSFNLSEQLRSAVLLLEEKWNAKDVNLEINFDEHVIEANEELLMQVWINLIDNAIKFVSSGGVVAIEVIDKTNEFCVSISNTGSEISEEKLEKIFNKFYQADESHATHGNGIGLAIVKRITELHKGRVGVTSRNELTTFCVSLPKIQK